MSKRLIFSLLICLSSVAYGQDFTNQVLFVDVLYNKEQQSSNWFNIYNCLTTLKDTISTGFFSEILWRDELENKSSEFAQILSNLDVVGDKEYKLSNQSRLELDSLIQLFIRTNFYLEIKVEGNHLNRNLIFSLYKMKTGSYDQNNSSIELPNILKNNLLRTEMCSLPIDQSKHNILIEKTIMRLFKDIVNQPPTIHILIDKLPYTAGDRVVRSPETSILIDLTGSNDDNTPREQFKYHWKQLGTLEAYNPIRKHDLQIKSTGASQSISPLNTGIYMIEVTVDDGIEQSKDTITLDIIQKPKLILSKYKHSKYQRVNLFQAWSSPTKLGNRIRDTLTCYLENYPNKTWTLNRIKDSYQRLGILNLPQQKMQVNQTNLDSIKQLSIKGLSSDKIIYYLYFQADYRGVKSDTVVYMIKPPYKVSIEEINIGVGSPFHLCVVPLLDGNYLRSVPCFPVNISIVSPILYFPGSNSYLGLEVDYHFAILDAYSRTRFSDGGGIKVKFQTPKPRSNFGFYYKIGTSAWNRGPSNLYQLNLTVPGIQAQWKYMAMSMDLLNLDINLNPFNVFASFAVKFDIGHWTEHQLQPRFDFSPP